MRRLRNLLGAGAVALAALSGGSWASAQEETRPAKSYWLGVECAPIDNEALRAQLNLEDDEGLIVNSVAPGSPAAEAGVKPFDILLQAGDEKLDDVSDLAEVVAHGGKFKLTVLRGGKEKTMVVAPTARPAEDEPVEGRRFKTARVQPFWQEGVPLPKHFRIVRPGAQAFAKALPVPKNLTVKIERQGDSPAKIFVQRDEDKWEITEEELDKLPEDVRPHVARMVGGNVMFKFEPGEAAAAVDVVVPNILHDIEPRQLLDKQFDRLNERINKLQELVKQLQKRTTGGGDGAAEPKVEGAPDKSELDVPTVEVPDAVGPRKEKPKAEKKPQAEKKPEAEKTEKKDADKTES